MNLVSRIIRVFCLLLIGLGISFGADVGRTSGDAGRLLVQRSPKFGTGMFLQIWIDGQSAGTIRPGSGYDAPIPAGNHTISVNYSPNTQHRSNSTALTVQPGQTYVFVATWDNAQGVVLRRSSANR